MDLFNNPKMIKPGSIQLSKTKRWYLLNYTFSPDAIFLIENIPTMCHAKLTAFFFLKRQMSMPFP